MNDCCQPFHDCCCSPMPCSITVSSEPNSLDCIVGKAIAVYFSVPIFCTQCMETIAESDPAYLISLNDTIVPICTACKFGIIPR